MKQGKARRRNPSQEVLCEFRGISEDLFNERIANGWTFNQAVLYPKECGSEFLDHEGNIFPSQAEMCRYWDVDPIEFQKRLKQCSDMESALTVGHKKKDTASSGMEAEDILDMIMPIVADLFYSVKPHTNKFACFLVPPDGGSLLRGSDSLSTIQPVLSQLAAIKPAGPRAG